MNEDFFISFDEPEFACRYKKYGGVIFVTSLVELTHRVSISLGSKGNYLHDYYYFRNKLLFYRSKNFVHKFILVLMKILTMEIARRILMRKKLNGLLDGVVAGLSGVTGEVRFNSGY